MCVLYRMEGRQRVYVGGASLIARNKVQGLAKASKDVSSPLNQVITVAHKFNVIQDKNDPVDWRDVSKETAKKSIKAAEDALHAMKNFVVID